MYEEQIDPLIKFIFSMVMTINKLLRISGAQTGLFGWPKHIKKFNIALFLYHEQELDL